MIELTTVLLLANVMKSKAMRNGEIARDTDIWEAPFSTESKETDILMTQVQFIVGIFLVSSRSVHSLDSSNDVHKIWQSRAFGCSFFFDSPDIYRFGVCSFAMNLW